ncbi:ATP-binding protein [Novosphingobium clariflavum]|uniref:ATP-binding protein n=1 Tax=Novosphingobium clariflavum TaxID=2029884 RepID=A0ABV6SCY1_9SPHN|nr:ATP-binding protein [Novosphingobium clariflavum]
MITVCLHGAESTGKSVLAARLGLPWVPEYGRAYCEERGTDLTMADLIAIAEGQAEENRKAMAAAPAVLLLDTDQLMTAAWAQMLFGEVPEVLMGYPKADHYLLFSPDVPWRDDGTRFFGTGDARARFAALAEEMLVRAAVPFTRIGGSWDAREAQVRAAIRDLKQRGSPEALR